MILGRLGSSAAFAFYPTEFTFHGKPVAPLRKHSCATNCAGSSRNIDRGKNIELDILSKFSHFGEENLPNINMCRVGDSKTFQLLRGMGVHCLPSFHRYATAV